MRRAIVISRSLFMTDKGRYLSDDRQSRIEKRRLAVFCPSAALWPGLF